MGKQKLLLKFHIWSFEYSTTDLGRSRIMFESMEQFMQITAGTLELVLESTSCLAMILETDDENEVSILIDFLSDLRFLESKYFLLQTTSGFDENLLSNKTLSFDVIISDTDMSLEGKDNSITNSYYCFWIGKVNISCLSTV